MRKQGPSIPAYATLILFTVSCFGLLLYLWLSFGGSTPLSSKGYRFHLLVPEVNQLAVQADVRISGVPVGKVVKVEPRGRSGYTDVEIEIEHQFAPIPRDTRAMLRQKTLLGETFIQLSPGSRDGPKLSDDGTLSKAQVEPTVEIDELLRAFPDDTRKAFRDFIASLDKSIDGRSSDISGSLGALPGTVGDASGLLRVLDSQEDAVTRLTHDSAVVFGAVGDRSAAVQRLVRSGDAVLRTTAARDRELRDTLQVLPVFLRETRATLGAVEDASRDLAPTVEAVKPVAPLLRPTLNDVIALSPDLEATFDALRPLVPRAREALPALTRVLKAARPVIQTVYPVTRSVPPVAEYAHLYRREVVNFFSKGASASNGVTYNAGTGKPVHTIRLYVPVNAEALTLYPARPGANRFNPYPAPGGLNEFARTLETFDCRHQLRPSIPLLSAALPCREQAPIEFQGKRQALPQLQPVGRGG